MMRQSLARATSLSKECEPAPPERKPTARELVQSESAFVMRSLHYLRVPEMQVSDAAQDVFVVALRRLDEFEGRSTIRTWLYGICLRVAMRYRRGTSSERRESLVDEMPDVAVAANQEHDLRKAEWQRKLDALLCQLGDAQRTVFVLYEIERMPMKDIATALGCPLQTAYYRYQAARQQVLEAFSRHRAMEET